mgnify:FL=1
MFNPEKESEVFKATKQQIEGCNLHLKISSSEAIKHMVWTIS